MFDRITIMTTGRKGTITTAFGVIEFTHTKRSINELSNNVYYDDEIGIFRATTEQAIKDLRRVGRNVEMIMPERSDA
jgi:hypothetical protein